MSRRSCFEAVLEAVPERGGAYVRFPYDLRQEFGRGRVRVQADFDGVPYRGSLVYMGVFREDGTPCPILGVRKDIRERRPCCFYRSVRGLALISQKWSSWREQARKISRQACWRSGLRSRQTRSVKSDQSRHMAS